LRTTRWKHSVAALTLLFFGKDVYSAHPLLTEDTATQGKGGWQLEVNGERQRDPQPEGVPPLRATQSGTTLSYGATDTIDLKVDLPYVHHQGALDASLGAKWRFYESGRLSFGLLGGLFLPTGDEEKGFGAGRTNASIAGIVFWQGESWEFQSHAGVRSNRNTIGQRESLGHFSAAALYRPSPTWWLAVDVAWDTNPDPAAGPSLRHTVYGVIWSVTKDFDLDAGIRTGNGPAIDTALLFGITLRWK
jgi:hypothetical protein